MFKGANDQDLFSSLSLSPLSILENPTVVEIGNFDCNRNDFTLFLVFVFRFRSLRVRPVTSPFCLLKRDRNLMEVIFVYFGFEMCVFLSMSSVASVWEVESRIMGNEMIIIAV